jgi:maleate isomerase
MPDRLGYRAKWGLVTPSRNTVIETELHRIVPDGITINTARAVREGPTRWDNDAAQKKMSQGLRAAEVPAIQELLECEPDAILIGDGAYTFTSGENGRGLSERYRALAGIPVITPSDAYWAAFKTLGIKRVANLGPRRIAGDPKEFGYWDWHKSGIDLVHLAGADCVSAFDIVNLPEDRVMALLQELKESGAEAVSATGTNFPLLRLAAEAERWLGLPVLHINTTLAWHALRSSGFNDRFPDFGVLLREH